MSNLQKYHVSNNLFDKNNIREGQAISEYGEIYDNANFGITYYIPVTANATYKLYGLFTTTAYTLRVHAYHDTTWISEVYNITVEPSATSINSQPFTMPSNANAVRLSIGIVNRQDLDILMFSNRLDLTEYEPYSADVWHELQPKIYANGAWTDSADNPKKYEQSLQLFNYETMAKVIWR